jgi:hypothetical protein
VRTIWEGAGAHLLGLAMAVACLAWVVGVAGAAAATTVTPPNTSAAAPLLIGAGAPRCPQQCHRRGVCTRGVCRCHRGSAGESCEREAPAPELFMPGEARQPPPPPPGSEPGDAGSTSATAAAAAASAHASSSGRDGGSSGAAARAPRLQVCVMTTQVLQTSTADDTDAVLPALPLAAHLARRGRAVQLEPGITAPDFSGCGYSRTIC